MGAVHSTFVGGIVSSHHSKMLGGTRSGTLQGTLSTTALILKVSVEEPSPLPFWDSAILESLVIIGN